MQITKLEDYGKQKKKLYLDGEYAFWLYYSDIREYNIREEQELSDNIYQELLTVIQKYAKQKALSFLEHMDRTEQELFQKLKQAGFPEDTISLAIEYVKKYHYIDDRRYALSYLRFHSENKSKRYLMNQLNQKGIDKKIAEQAYHEIIEEYGEENAELLALRKEIQKKIKNQKELDTVTKKKLVAALFRKGYSYDMIQKELNF